MGKIVSTIIKLALLCFVVGLFLAFFDIDPVNLMRHFPETVYSIFEVLVGWVRAAVPYITLGAVVVLPIWLILTLLKMARGKRGGTGEA